MTAEQFLNSIRHLDNEISALDLERCRWMDRRQDLLESAESHSAITGVVVQHAISSKTESIGIELDADYFKIAEKRIAEAQQAGKQLAI